MNKKLLSLILAGATALSLSTAFAEDDYGTMLISEEVVETVQEEKHAAYITISGKITGVEEETFLAQTESLTSHSSTPQWKKPSSRTPTSSHRHIISP